MTPKDRKLAITALSYFTGNSLMHGDRVGMQAITALTRVLQIEFVEITKDVLETLNKIKDEEGVGAAHNVADAFIKGAIKGANNVISEAGLEALCNALEKAKQP